MAAENMQNRTKRRRWPTVLLALSLTLNFLVLGMIAGAHFRDDRDMHGYEPRDAMAMRDSGFGPVIEAMPREARSRMAAAMRARGVELRPDREALIRDLAGMLASLRADPFKPAALATILTEQHGRVSERIALGREVLVDEIAEMSPEARRALADALEARLARALDLDRPRP